MASPDISSRCSAGGQKTSPAKYAQLILDHLMDLKEDGSFRLDLSYFDYCTGLAMTSDKFHTLFDGPPRDPDTWLTQRDMDLAASIQAVTEEVVLRLVRGTASEMDSRNLCLAGGVAFNCVANGKIMRVGAFDRLWIQPAAGDAGGALGAALGAYHLFLGQGRQVNTRDSMEGSYLGPEFAQADIERRLEAAGAKFTVLDDERLIADTAGALADQRAVGWSQGRMEFGPRALGARSILGDPRSPTMQKTLNMKVK